MGKALTLILLALLAHAPASAQSAPSQPQSNGPTASRKAQTPPELEEAARLNAQVLQLFREGKYEEALPIAKRVLELREKVVGPDGLLVAYALNNIASIYTARSKSGDAEPLFERALAIVGKQGAAESDFAADLNMQLGIVRTSARDFKGASAALESALAVKEKLHGKEDPALLNTLFAFTDVNFLRGDREHALETLGRAAAIIRKQTPKKDEATASRLRSYLCPLYAVRREEDKEIQQAVSSALWRLEEPEKAAEVEGEAKTREALGMSKEIVGGAVLNGRAVSKPAPEYPAAAKQQRVMGTVVVRLIVDESGKVIKADAVCGHPLLARAAVDAARGARFTPTTLAGRPVKVSGIITYTFILQ
jgi:TonB family protein